MYQVQVKATASAYISSSQPDLSFFNIDSWFQQNNHIIMQGINIMQHSAVQNHSVGTFNMNYTKF